MKARPKRRAVAKRAAYKRLLLDPRWQKKRLEILARDKWMCQACKATTRTLHVHHRWYAAGTMPWDYPASCYVTLCVQCHRRQDAAQRRGDH